jgi:hypothetical protein
MKRLQLRLPSIVILPLLFFIFVQLGLSFDSACAQGDDDCGGWHWYLCEGNGNLAVGRWRDSYIRTHPVYTPISSFDTEALALNAVCPRLIDIKPAETDFFNAWHGTYGGKVYGIDSLVDSEGQCRFPAHDADGDAVPDQEDFCPDTPPDTPVSIYSGCRCDRPDINLEVALSCSPQNPDTGVRVSCTASVQGELPDGQYQITWFLDGNEVSAGTSSNWQWTATRGIHFVRVDVEDIGPEHLGLVSDEVVLSGAIDGEGGVILGVKTGSPDRVEPDGQSQTLISVDIDPSAACWGGAPELNGMFYIEVETSLGFIGPRSDIFPIPGELTFTAGTNSGQAQIHAVVHYCPPGGVMAFGVCSDQASLNRVCEGRTVVGVGESSGITRPDEESTNPDDRREVEFRVDLGCQPVKPMQDDVVTCSAGIEGASEGEVFEYSWYLDYVSTDTGSSSQWSWDKAEKGVHDIGVVVVGEDHHGEADLALEVEALGDLVARISLLPDPPVKDKSFTFTAVLEGQKQDEVISYTWALDGQPFCEDASCTVSEGLEGSHALYLEVHGQDDRWDSAFREFVLVTGDEVEDAGEAAGFSILSLHCTDDIISSEVLSCDATFQRENPDIDDLNVIWLIDGAMIASDQTRGNSSSFDLPNPAPGRHAIIVRVIDPLSGLARVQSTTSNVSLGMVGEIPPWAQLGAAGGTLGLVGVWLWAEWLNARRAEAEEARLRAQQKPSWVDDKRSLEEIWAAEEAAERQRRGLWGFRYDKMAGVFSVPEWAQGLTEAQRKDLLASGGKMPWWWGNAQVAWERERQVLRDAKLRADRSLEREWLREIAQESSFDKRRRDWIYKAEKDAWEKAPWHEDEREKRNRARLLGMDRAIDALVDKLPVSQWGKIEALQEKILGDGRVGAEEYLQLMRLKGAVYNLKQAQFDADAARAMHDAAWMQLGEEAASNIKTGATVASVAIAFSPILLGGAGWALGATSLTNAAAAVSGAMAQLGAFRLTMNLVEGATVGYIEGGFNAAVVGGMRRTLPINTMSLWLGPRMPGEKGPGWKRIGLSVLQDFGNAMTLKRGIAQYRQLARRAGASISNSYQRLTGTGEQPLRMPPVRNNVLLQRDAQWWAEREQGQRLVNNFNRTLRKMQAATSRTVRADLSNQLSKQAIQINENYAAKSILKVIKRPGLTRAFDQRIQRIYRVVDYRVAKELNAAGITRGGQAFSRNDLINFRNASSYGTVGMDRDVGLNQMLVQKWEGVVNQATPGTEWHAHAVAKLQQAQRASQLGMGGQRLSLANFNQRAQEIYNAQYAQVTGGNAERAFQMVTTSGHVEAYKDISVLQNNPMGVPFSGQWAGQTGSVSAVKVYENFKLASDGVISQGSAIQESARGLAKDISTKLIPLLKANPGVNPAQITYWQGMQRLLGQAGQGNVTPGQLLQTLNTDQSGIIRMAERVSAGIQGAIQSR